MSKSEAVARFLQLAAQVPIELRWKNWKLPSGYEGFRGLEDLAIYFEKENIHMGWLRETSGVLEIRDVDLSNVDLSSKDLRKIKFSSCQFSKTNFSRSVFRSMTLIPEAVFQSCTFHETEFSDALLSNLSFSGCKSSDQPSSFDISLSGAKLKGVRFGESLKYKILFDSKTTIVESVFDFPTGNDFRKDLIHLDKARCTRAVYLTEDLRDSSEPADWVMRVHDLQSGNDLFPLSVMNELLSLFGVLDVSIGQQADFYRYYFCQPAGFKSCYKAWIEGLKVHYPFPEEGAKAFWTLTYPYELKVKVPRE